MHLLNLGEIIAMREKLILRVSSKRVFDPYIKRYPRFKEKWLTFDSALTKGIEGYLDEVEFKKFLEYLRAKLDYQFSFIRREYKESEIISARLLTMSITPTFEPTGEQLGTEYQDKCTICRAGRIVTGDLILDLTKVPRVADMAKTIARDEWVVSERMGSLIEDNKVRGCELKPVRHHKNRKLKKMWYQLTVNSTVKISGKTRYGDAFRHNMKIESIKSPCGHTINMFPFSEVYIKKNSWDGSDIVKTDLYFGGQLNLIYPAPEVLISQRFYRLLREKNIKGFRIEIAHLV